MGAAQEVIKLGRNDCLDEIVETLQSDDFMALWMAASMLEQLPNLPASELEEVRNQGQFLLKNKSPALRGAAARLLGKFGDTYSVDSLRSALSTEPDKEARRG
jgi:HEAT repeat protein